MKPLEWMPMNGRKLHEKCLSAKEKWQEQNQTIYLTLNEQSNTCIYTV